VVTALLLSLRDEDSFVRRRAALAAGKNPGVEGGEGGVGDEGDETFSLVNNAIARLQFVFEGAAEQASPRIVVVADRLFGPIAPLVGDDGEGGELGVGMFEGSAGAAAVVFKKDDGFHPGIVPQFGVALAVDAEDVGDVFRRHQGGGQIVAGMFDDHLVIADAGERSEDAVGLANPFPDVGEGGIFVAHHPHPPAAIVGQPQGFGGARQVFVSGTEGAVFPVLGQVGPLAVRGGKFVGSSGPFRGDDHPVSGGGVLADLRHAGDRMTVDDDLPEVPIRFEKRPADPHEIVGCLFGQRPLRVDARVNKKEVADHPGQLQIGEKAEMALGNGLEETIADIHHANVRRHLVRDPHPVAAHRRVTAKTQPTGFFFGIDEKIEEAEEFTSAADTKKSGLLEEQDSLKEIEAKLESVVTAQEALLKKTIARMPTPLREEIAPLTRRIPQDPENTTLSVSQRLQSIVGILTQVDKFNTTVEVAPEQREFEGNLVQVTAIYFGLGAAYYADKSGDHAGYGRASESGWEWIPDVSIAQKVLSLIEMYEGNTTEIEFVPMPVNLNK